jgi:hypothetical protein
MQSARKHIAGFLLLLSITLVLPVAYWHECPDHPKSVDSIEIYPEQVTLDGQHLDCDLCDYVFAPFHLSEYPSYSLDLSQLLVPVPLSSLEDVPGFLPQPPLRAPPTG